MKDFNELLKQVGNFFVNSWPNIVAALIVLIVGGILVSLLGKLLMKIIYSTKIDNAAGGFFVALLKIVLWVFILFGCASLMGLDANSFLVAFSSVALAIGLVLKDSLNNIAHGILIVVNKPFKKGDYVAVSSVEGTVRKITIFTTELTTGDNKKIVLPNSTVSNGNIVNYSANPTRRVDATYGVSYDSDMKKVKEILYNTINNYDYALKNPTPIIYMESHNSSSVDFKVRFWVNNSDYWNALYGLNEKVFEAFKENNITIPFNTIDVNITSEKESL